MPRPDGKPTIAEILASCADDFDPREYKPWPEEEDCSGCDQHKNGPHRLSCHMAGGYMRIPVAIEPKEKK